MEIRQEGDWGLVKLSLTEFRTFQGLDGLPSTDVRYSPEFLEFLQVRDAEFAGAFITDSSFGPPELVILIRPVRRKITTCSCDQDGRFR